ncbi:MAG: glycosyltransferase family 4 protein [Thermoplasmata archaeon]
MIVSNPVSYDARVMNEAESLVRQGYSVTILGWDRTSQFPQKETNGVRLIRLRNTAYMKLLRFDLLRLRPWWRLAYRTALGLHQRSRFHAVHCHDLDTLPTGVRLKRKLGVPLVYDAHEIWGYMVSKDLPSSLANYYLWKERGLIRHANAVITVNEPLREYFEGISSVPVTVVMNAKPIVTRKYIPPQNDIFTLIYIGTLNEARFVMQLVDVVSEFNDVELRLAGLGKPAYVTTLQGKCRKVPNVHFMGAVPQRKVLPLTMRADAVISLTDPSDKNISIAMGNKLFEAMVCGRPIIVSKDSYQSKLIAEHGVGIAVEHTIDGVRKGIAELRDNPEMREVLGRQALEKALGEFNWERQEGKLVEIYEGL